MRILGIDPGTGILGFGIIDALGSKAKMVDAGVITTAKTTTQPEKLQIIYDELCGIIRETKPETMVVEKLFFAQNVTTAMTVAEARGIVMLCGQQAGLTIFEYTPMQIKLALVGYGKAEKRQVQEMVKILLGLKTIPTPDDCADALAAALTHTTQMMRSS